MAPTVISSRYAKDLSTLPLVSGAVVSTRQFFILMPSGDNRIFRLDEHRYQGGDYDYITRVSLCKYLEPHYIRDHIQGMRLDDCSDGEIIDLIASLRMEAEEQEEVVARFAYDDFSFTDPTYGEVTGVQIRGAFVHEDHSGEGLAVAVYRQLAIQYGHVASDNTQTHLRARLWAVSIRTQVGEVRIYDCVRRQIVDYLGEGYAGIQGYQPWDYVPPEHPRVDEQADPERFAETDRRYVVLILSA